jgi:hypothetical protein
MSNYRTPALDGRFACARCGERHEASSGTYSPDGELLCRGCIARDVVAGSCATDAPDPPRALAAGVITTTLRRPGRRALWALGLFGGAILLAAGVMFLVVAALGSHG